MGYSGNMYAQATEVITSQGDLRRGDSSGNPERLAIGSSGKVLQSNGTTESWETLSTADSVLTTQGDVLYESASGLARLGFGTSGDVLTTKGTGANPVWETPAGGGGQMVLVSHNVLGADATDIDVSFTSIGQDDISSLFFIYCGTTVDTSILRMQVNGLTNSQYDSSGMTFIDTTVASIGSTSASSGILVPQTDREFYAMCWLTIGNSNMPSDKKDIRWRAITQNAQHGGGSSAGAYQTNGGQPTGFTQIKLFPDSGNMRAGTTLDIFRINNS